MPKKETSRIDWKVGILPTGDCFIHFSNGVQHFECTLTEDSAEQMGKALLETAKQRRSGWKPTIDSPSFVSMKSGKPQ